MTLVAEKVYTIEEYFEIEKKSEERHEFVHGNLMPMPGESKIANKIVGNCYFFLRQFLYDKGYDIFVEDVRLRVDTFTYRYPDLVVAAESDSADTHAIQSPALIIEVLSESTRVTDQTEKLLEYCNLPSLQYYLMIEQDKYLVACYSRSNAKQWTYQIFETLNEAVDLAFFDTHLKLNEIYSKINFE
jgi:Uma2 family endonuclease